MLGLPSWKAHRETGETPADSPLLPRLLTLAATSHPAARTRWRYRLGGGGGSTMEFFPKAYARGPSQLWLCSGTLLPTSCGPNRPALLTEASVLSGTVCRVFSFCPAVLLRGSPLHPPRSSCEPLQLAEPRSLRCTSLRAAGTWPGQAHGEQRVCLPPPSWRVGRRLDPEAWKAEFSV